MIQLNDTISMIEGQPIDFQGRGRCNLGCDMMKYDQNDRSAFQVILGPKNDVNLVTNGDFSNGLTDWNADGIQDIGEKACNAVILDDTVLDTNVDTAAGLPGQITIASAVVPATGTYTVDQLVQYIDIQEGQAIIQIYVDAVPTALIDGYFAIDNIPEKMYSTDIAANSGQTISVRVTYDLWAADPNVIFSIASWRVEVYPATGTIHQDVTLVAEAPYKLSFDRLDETVTVTVYETADPLNIVLSQVINSGLTAIIYFDTLTGITDYTIRFDIDPGACVDNVVLVAMQDVELQMKDSGDNVVYDTASPAPSNLWIEKKVYQNIVQFNLNFAGNPNLAPPNPVPEGCYTFCLYDPAAAFTPIRSNQFCICEDLKNSCENLVKLIAWYSSTNVMNGDVWLEFENLEYRPTMNLMCEFDEAGSYSGTGSNYLDCLGFSTELRNLQRPAKTFTLYKIPLMAYDSFLVAVMTDNLFIDSNKYQATEFAEIQPLYKTRNGTVSIQIQLHQIGSQYLREIS